MNTTIKSKVEKMLSMEELFAQMAADIKKILG